MVNKLPFSLFPGLPGVLRDAEPAPRRVLADEGLGWRFYPQFHLSAVTQHHRALGQNTWAV